MRKSNLLTRSLSLLGLIAAFASQAGVASAHTGGNVSGIVRVAGDRGTACGSEPANLFRGAVRNDDYRRPGPLHRLHIAAWRVHGDRR